jgi:hypothetical protein
MEVFDTSSAEFAWAVAAYLYIFFGWSLSIVARKTGTNGAGLAWIPLANFWLLIRISGRPGLWFIILLFPGLNLVALAILWNDVSGACGKNAALAWLVLLAPLVAFVSLAGLGQAPFAATGAVALGALALVHGYVAFGSR